MNVGERLAEILRQLDAPVVFGVPGGQTLPLYGATRALGMTHVVMRDERNAACAADAYARVSGSIGVCDATVGPGVTNLVSGLAEAFAASVPVLAIVADIRTDQEHLRRRAVVSQAFDQGPLLATVAKWVGRVGRGHAVDDVTDQAVRVATSGRPGPVVIEVPEDVWLESATAGRRFDPADVRPPRSRPSPNRDAVVAAAGVLSSATRPLVLAGGGVLASGAGQELRLLAEGHRLPVVTTINGKGALDESSELAVGVVGLFGQARAALALDRADAVLVVGSKLDQVTTHGWRLPTAGARIVHVDVDGEELGRVVRPDVGVVADAREFLAALREQLPAAPGGARPWSSELDPRVGTANGHASVDGPRMHPADVIAAVDAVLEADDVVVCDASYVSGWAAAGLHITRPRHFVAPRGLAGIGWSGGAAVGARLAAGAAGRVIVLAGDGAWAYGMAELETAARLGLDITYVVLNNAALGWIVHGEDHLGIVDQSTFTDVDFATVARGLGASGGRVTTRAELVEQLHLALSRPGPHLIDAAASVDPSPIVSLRQVRGGAEQPGAVR